MDFSVSDHIFCRTHSYRREPVAFWINHETSVEHGWKGAIFMIWGPEFQFRLYNTLAEYLQARHLTWFLCRSHKVHIQWEGYFLLLLLQILQPMTQRHLPASFPSISSAWSPSHCLVTLLPTQRGLPFPLPSDIYLKPTPHFLISLHPSQHLQTPPSFTWQESQAPSIAEQAGFLPEAPPMGWEMAPPHATPSSRGQAKPQEEEVPVCSSTVLYLYIYFLATFSFKNMSTVFT